MRLEEDVEEESDGAWLLVVPMAAFLGDVLLDDTLGRTEEVDRDTLLVVPIGAI